MAENFSINFIFNKWDGHSITKVTEPFSKYSEAKRFSHFGTYDENIIWKENSQATLTFKILRQVHSTINPFFQFITNGRELQLEYRNKYYEFIITSVVPKFYKENLEYEVTCQDAFSYFLAKNNVGANYADDEDATVFKWTGKTIGELARSILEQSGYKNKWSIDPNLGKTMGVPNFPATIYGFNTREENIATLELEGSNTLNGLIELTTLFNARIEVVYPKNPNEQRIIYFRNKNVAHNSYVVLDKNVNLNDLGLSNTSEEFCTVLHVSGGTDANENIVSLVQPMPSETKLAIQQEINKALEENKTITFFNDLYEPSLFYDNKWEQNGDFFPTLIIEGKQYTNIPYDKNEKNVTHDGYNIDYTNYTEDSKNFVVIKSITKGEEEVSSYVYPLLNENYKPISFYARNDKYNPGYGSMCKQVPCLSSVLFDFSYLEETYQLPQEAHREIKRILCKDYFNANVQIQLYADSYYNLLRLYNQQIQQEEEAVFKISQAYNALMQLAFENNLNTKVSVMYSALNPAIQKLIDVNIENENQFISLTNEDYYTSIIYDGYQSLWSLWENNSPENNYLETQFNYFAGKNNATFIEERKKKYRDLASTYIGELKDCLDQIKKLLTPYRKNEENKPLEDFEYPFLSTVSVTDSDSVLHYIKINREYFKNLIDFENKLKNYDSVYVAYSVHKKRIEELFFYLGVCVEDSNSDAKVYYDGYCTCYYRAMKILQDYCNTYTSNPDNGVIMDDLSLGAVNNIINIKDSKETLTVNYETAEWLSHLTANYHRSKNNCIDWLTFYNNAVKQQEKIWNSLMERFGDFIIEGTYSDEAQIDSLGLYTAAATQFENMKRPQFNYSLKTIDWDLLKTSFYDFPEVGDIIAVKHVDLALFQRSQSTKHITVRCELPKEGVRFQKGFFEKDGVQHRSVGAPFQQNGKWYLDFDLTYGKGSNIPSSFNFINRIYWDTKTEITKTYEEDDIIDVQSEKFIGKIKVTLVDEVQRTKEFEFELPESSLSSTTTLMYSQAIDTNYRFAIGFRAANGQMAVYDGTFKLYKNNEEVDVSSVAGEYILYDCYVETKSIPDKYCNVINRFIVKDERNIENTITEISQNLRDKTFSISLSNQQAVEKIVKKLLRSIRYY